MRVRQEIYDTYWRFAAERQEVFFNKINNMSPPWTSDPILNTYKFCNAYRASDRVSQYLIKNIIYDENRSQNDEEILFRIFLYKIFNKIETWEYLESRLGDYISLSSFNFQMYSNLLQDAMETGHVIYTSAYMSCASKEFGYDKKHQNHLALIEKMVVKDRVVSRIVSAKSLEEVFNIIQEYPLLGKFMAYQLATDINYSEIINFDENSFTIAGPGSERGIGKCFLDTDGKSNADIIQWMTENQEWEFQRLGLNFQSLWGRAIVIEEGISALVFTYAKNHGFLEGVSAIDYQLLKTIKNMTSHLEVSQCSLGDWEKAIMMGYEVWRLLEKYREGTVVVDLDARSITYQIEKSNESSMQIQPVYAG